MKSRKIMQRVNNTAITVFSLAAIFSLAPLAIDMYLPAFPTMATTFGTQIDSMEATISVFLLGYALSQLILGPISDLIGRIPVLISGLILFAIASFMVALANTTSELYFFRFLQAFGGGASVTVYAYINDHFNEKQSTQIISYIMAVVPIAPLVAPIIGGEILVAFGWEWIFYGLSIYAMLVITMIIFIFGKDSKTQKTKSYTSNHNTNPIREILSAYMYVLNNRRVMAHLFTGSFAFAGLFAFVAGSPYVYIEYYGVAANHYGYFVAANASTMIILNIINAKYLNDYAPTPKMIIASVLLSIVSVSMLISIAIKPSLIFIAISTAIFIGLLGLVASNAIAGALNSTNKHAGTVSALHGVIQFTLGALSSGIISVMISDDASTMLSVMAISGLLALASALTLLNAQPQTFVQNEA